MALLYIVYTNVIDDLGVLIDDSLMCSDVLSVNLTPHSHLILLYFWFCDGCARMNMSQYCSTTTELHSKNHIKTNLTCPIWGQQSWLKNVECFNVEWNCVNEDLWSRGQSVMFVSQFSVPACYDQ